MPPSAGRTNRPTSLSSVLVTCANHPSYILSRLSGVHVHPFPQVGSYLCPNMPQSLRWACRAEATNGRLRPFQTPADSRARKRPERTVERLSGAQKGLIQPGVRQHIVVFASMSCSVSATSRAHMRTDRPLARKRSPSRGPTQNQCPSGSDLFTRDQNRSMSAGENTAATS